MAVPQASGPNSSYRAPIIIVLLLVAALGGYRFFFNSHTGAPSRAVSTQNETQSDTGATPQYAAQAPAPPAKSSALPRNSALENTGTPGARPVEKAKPAPKSEGTSATISDGASGTVAHEALPEIPESALHTIHGKFQVIVRTTSDTSGKVSDASIESPGPSQYFANLALKASRAWKFSPNAPGDWLIRFEFTSDGTTASAAPAK
jgi:TonB family protein